MAGGGGAGCTLLPEKARKQRKHKQRLRSGPLSLTSDKLMVFSVSARPITRSFDGTRWLYLRFSSDTDVPECFRISEASSTNLLLAVVGKEGAGGILRFGAKGAGGILRFTAKGEGRRLYA